MPIIQSVERALDILELFDDTTPELKITEISASLQLHKSTVHSLLKTLQQRHYIDQNPDNGKYRLGLKLLEKSGHLLQRLDISKIAKPVLAQLAKETGQTAHLVVLDGSEGVYLDKVEGERAVIRYSQVGKRVSLHCSAVGKVLAADLEPKRLSELLQDYRFFRRTERTISSVDAFHEALMAARENGYALDDEENEPGVRCIAVPIRDHTGGVVAAVSISMLIVWVSEEEFAAYKRLLLSQGSLLSAQLGYKSTSL